MLKRSTHIGERIKAAMVEKNVGPTEVGKHFGVQPPSVNDWVSTGRIHKRHLAKLVSYFGRPLEWWLDGNVTDATKLYPKPPLASVLSTAHIIPLSKARYLIDDLGEILDACEPETRSAVAGLIGQYVLNPKPGAVADALVMFLDRCTHSNADNPWAGAAPGQAPAPRTVKKPVNTK